MSASGSKNVTDEEKTHAPQSVTLPDDNYIHLQIKNLEVFLFPSITTVLDGLVIYILLRKVERSLPDCNLHKVQWNMHIKTTLGTNKIFVLIHRWPLYPGSIAWKDTPGDLEMQSLLAGGVYIYVVVTAGSTVFVYGRNAPHDWSVLSTHASKWSH